MVEPLRTILERFTAEPLPDDCFHDRCQKLLRTDENAAIVRERNPNWYDPWALPVWCECEQEQQVVTKDLRAGANLPNEHEPKTFENFDKERSGLWSAVDAATKIAAGEHPWILTLSGSVGTGKSHLAEAVARSYLDHGMSVRHEFVPDLCRQMREASGPRSDESADLLLAPAFAAELLWLDDLGMEKGSDFTAERLTNLVQDRVTRNKLLIVTTNRTRDEMREGFGGAYFRLASRLYDIHTGTVRVVTIEAKDYRVEGA